MSRRASLTTPAQTGRETRSQGVAEEEDDDSVSTVAYPRRNIRVGGAYQVKTISKVGQPLSDRPKPDLMSREIPFLSEAEVTGEDTKNDTGESIWVYSLSKRLRPLQLGPNSLACVRTRTMSFLGVYE